MAVQVFDVSVRLATVVNVMRPVAAATAIQTPAAIDVADAKEAAFAGAQRGFQISYPLASVFGDFSSTLKRNGRKTTFAVDGRFFDCEAWREFQDS